MTMSADPGGGPEAGARTAWVTTSNALAAAAIAVVVFVTARGLAGGYVAMRDRAMIALRSRDVLTEHHPLVGMASSGSTPESAFNHPGPLLFDVLAAPVRLLGDSTGIAVGAALINIVAIVGIVVAARGVGGERVAVLGAAGTCALAWIMGSETLYDAWNPNVLVLPFLWFALLAWHVACGGLRRLPLAVAVGSFCVQAHLGFPIVVGVVLAAALVAGIRWPLSEGGAVRRPLALAAAVGLVAWAQPIWEQLFGDGKGNLSRIFGAGSDAENIAGPTFAARVFADVLSPVSWVRPHFEKLWTGFTPHALPSERWTAVILVAAGAAAIALAVAVVRRAPGLGRLWLVFIAGCVGGYVTVARLPLQFGVTLSSYYIRWIWPLVVLGLIAAAASLWVLVGHRLVSADIAGCAAIAAAIGLLVMTLPTRGLATQPPYRDAVSAVRDQVAANADRIPEGTRVEMRSDTLAWHLPYPYEISAELIGQDVDVVVRRPFSIRQYGPRRATRPGDVASVYAVVGKDAPQTGRDGVVRLARVGDTPDGPVTVIFDPG